MYSESNDLSELDLLFLTLQIVTEKKTYISCLERYICKNRQSVVPNNFSFLFFHFRQLKNGIDYTQSLNGCATIRDIFVDALVKS